MLWYITTVSKNKGIDGGINVVINRLNKLVVTYLDGEIAIPEGKIVYLMLEGLTTTVHAINAEQEDMYDEADVIILQVTPFATRNPNDERDFSKEEYQRLLTDKTIKSFTLHYQDGTEGVVRVPYAVSPGVSDLGNVLLSIQEIKLGWEEGHERVDDLIDLRFNVW